MAAACAAKASKPWSMIAAGMKGREIAIPLEGFRLEQIKRLAQHQLSAPSGANPAGAVTTGSGQA